jgi:hypothetical protein
LWFVIVADVKVCEDFWGISDKLLEHLLMVATDWPKVAHGSKRNMIKHLAASSILSQHKYQMVGTGSFFS